MTGVDVGELRRRLAGATRGPWRQDGVTVRVPYLGEWPGLCDCDGSEPDAALIVALVNNASALLDAAEAVDRVTALADEWAGRVYDTAVSRGDPSRINRCGRDLRAALVAPDNHNKEDTP